VRKGGRPGKRVIAGLGGSDDYDKTERQDSCGKELARHTVAVGAA
jgi:hypothetical protein